MTPNEFMTAACASNFHRSLLKFTIAFALTNEQNPRNADGGVAHRRCWRDGIRLERCLQHRRELTAYTGGLFTAGNYDAAVGAPARAEHRAACARHARAIGAWGRVLSTSLRAVPWGPERRPERHRARYAAVARATG